MSSNNWNQTLITAQGSGTALSNTTTATSILPAQAKLQLWANSLKIGDILRVRAGGQISTAGASPGTLTLDVRAGASTVLFNGGASPTLAVSASNLTWEMEAYLTVLAAGAAANVRGIGKLLSMALSASTPVQMLPASAPAAGSNFDNTTSNVIDLFATWSVASASNSIQLMEYELALLT